ncbi:MAG: Hpt domain-containing protein [Halobacteriovoraceae bacterium]|nr:Hpt domain-containing protein [Halobacteriovoraceae bacterium]
MIDKQKLLTHFDNDLELLSEIFEELRALSKRNINLLEKSIADKNFEAIEREAHTIKGACSNFFAQKVTDAAFVIEEKGRSKKSDNLENDFKVLNELVIELISEVELLIKGENAA